MDLHTITFDELRTEELRNGTAVMLGTIFYNVEKERLRSSNGMQ
jgi:hypothetical protein